MTTTSGIFSVVRRNRLVATGESILLPVVETYISPLVGNVRENVIIRVKDKTKAKGKRIAEKADAVARTVVSVLPVNLAKSVLSQLGDTRLVKTARSVADSSLALVTETTEKVFCFSLSAFDRQVIDRLCELPAPQLDPKGTDMLPYMQDRLRAELLEFAKFHLRQIHDSRAYTYINGKLELDARFLSANEFYQTGGIARLDWPQEAKERVCSLLTHFGLGSKLVGLIDSFVWVKLDSDSDGKVTVGDIFVTAQHVAVEFPKQATRRLFRRFKPPVQVNSNGE